MTTEAFDHLAAFGLAAAEIPARKAARLLATETQLDLLDGLLADAKPGGLSLRELREPDLSRINYLDAVRGEVARKWQPVVDNVASVPPPRLLGDLDTTWKAAEGRIAGEAQQRVAAVFSERAACKAAIAQEEASRTAAERGLPAVTRWIESLKEQCDQARSMTARDLAKFSEQRKRQLKGISGLKEDWTKLLTRDDGDVTSMARRFLVLAGAVLLLGYGLWALAIPVNSVGGMVAVALTILVALMTARPLFRRLRFSRRTTMTASNLLAAYRASSLLGLDEMAKRQEVDYATTLRDRLDGLLDQYRERIAELEARRAEIAEEQTTLQATLYEAPPTIRVILSDESLAEWRQRGRAQAPLVEWRRRLGSVSEPADWESIDREAEAAFAFARQAGVEDEIHRTYPAREARLGFLRSLRDAAIGASPGEAFLSLDLGVTAGKPPQTFLLVEVEDPTSPLAQEITSAWAGAGVGVSLVRSSDPAMLSLIGFVYGYRLDAQRDWPGIETAFQQILECEGPGIYPVLFPESEGPKEQAATQPSPTPPRKHSGAVRRANGDGTRSATPDQKNGQAT